MKLQSIKARMIYLSMLAVAFVMIANLVVAQEAKADGGKDYLHHKRGVGYLQFFNVKPLGVVFIDSMRVKLSPDGIQPVRAGRHVVRIKSPDRCNWYIRDFVDTVFVSSGDTLSLSVVFPRFVLLNSQPYGAEVFCGDKSIGYTPVLVSSEILRAGNLSLRKIGYFPVSIMEPDSSLQVLWIPLQKSEKCNQVQMTLRSRAQKQPGHSKFWTYTSFSVAVLSGITALVTKNEADHYYRRYLQSTDPNTMQKYYDQTQKFDRYAGTSYVFFELSFITSIYLLVKNIDQ